MQVHPEFPTAPPPPCAITVGTFDGVHRGHQQLTQVLRDEAARRGLQTAVVTFTDMPFCYFKPDECPRLLTLADEKIAAFGALHLDHIVIPPFTRQIAEQTARQFVGDNLVQKLNMKLLVAGPDFALGKGRGGDIPTLRALGAELGFAVVVLDQKLLEGERPISSTRTREAVEAGDVATATRLLGHPFAFSGAVIGGRKLGRTIGVPTINLKLHERKVFPRYGIYAAWAYFDDQTTPHRAALSIGSNPTVGGTSLSIEFHVIGEEVPIPPAQARLEVIARLRDEQKFAGIPELVAQMQRDIAQAAALLS